MTDRGLDRAIDFAKSRALRRVEKKRIITEPVFPLRGESDTPFTGFPHNPLYLVTRLRRAKREGANKSPGSFLFRNFPQFVHQFFIIFSIIPLFTAIARRINPWCSVESIDLETGDIGQS